MREKLGKKKMERMNVSPGTHRESILDILSIIKKIWMIQF